MQNAWAALDQRGRMMAGGHPAAASLDADPPDPPITPKRMEESDRIRPAADAGDEIRGETPHGRKHLAPAPLVASHPQRQKSLPKRGSR